MVHIDQFVSLEDDNTETDMDDDASHDRRSDNVRHCDPVSSEEQDLMQTMDDDIVIYRHAVEGIAEGKNKYVAKTRVLKPKSSPVENYKVRWDFWEYVRFYTDFLPYPLRESFREKSMSLGIPITYMTYMCSRTSHKLIFTGILYQQWYTKTIIIYF